MAEIEDDVSKTPTTSSIKILPKVIDFRTCPPSPPPDQPEISAADVESAHMEIVDSVDDPASEPGTSNMSPGEPPIQPESPHILPPKPPVHWTTKKSEVQNPVSSPVVQPPRIPTGKKTKARKRPLGPLSLEEKNPLALDRGELYKTALIKQYQLANVQLETDKILRTTAQDVVNGLKIANDSSRELTDYLKRLTEIEEKKLALKQKSYEERIAMEREKHELFKKKTEAEIRYYSSKADQM